MTNPYYAETKDIRCKVCDGRAHDDRYERMRVCDGCRLDENLCACAEEDA